MGTDVDDLIKKLESAECGSYSLSCEIGDALNLDKRYEHPGSQEPNHLPYTTSLDAALTLVPEGHWITMGTENDNTGPKGPWATIWHDLFVSANGHGPSLSLALCIAALKARQANDQSS